MDSPIEFYRMAYASTLLSSVAYGAYALMAYGAIYLLLQRGRKRGRGEQLVLGYSIFMLAVTTAWYIAGARAKAYGFVDAIFDPDAVEQISCSPAGVIFEIMAAVQILCSDLLLLYRMHIMWSELPLLAVLPGLAWLTSLVLGILICLECWTSEWDGPLQLPSPLVLHEAFFPITVFINVFTSAAIAWKLWQHRRVLQSGKSESVAAPMTVVGILCESAAVYAVVGVILAAFYARQGVVVPLLSTLFQVLAFLSPTIIVLRVSLGMSYTRSSDYYTSSIRFHTQPHSGVFDGSAASRSSLHFASHGRSTMPDPENLVLPGLIPGDQRSTSSNTEVDGEAMSLGKVHSREL